MTYAHQKLKNAVEALQDKRIGKRQWLEGNEVYHVLHLLPEELPHDARADFEQLRLDPAFAGMRESATRQIDLARSMPHAEVERLARCIVELYFHVDAAIYSRLHHPRRPPHALAVRPPAPM